MRKPDQVTQPVGATAFNGAAGSERKRIRHRRWSTVEKVRITRESSASSESVTALAARYGIARDRLSAWRSQLRLGKLVSPSSAKSPPPRRHKASSYRVHARALLPLRAASLYRQQERPVDRSKRYVIRDDAVTGLILRVLPSGTHTYTIERVVHGRRRYANLGDAATLSVPQARCEARRLIAHFSEPARTGIDPRTPGHPMTAFAGEFFYRQSHCWDPRTR